MRTAIATLKSVSPYNQSRAHETPKLDREGPDAYEERTWRERTHTDEKGRIVIPPMSFKWALDAAAKMLGMKIPGKRNATFTKFFFSGVLCIEGATLPITKDQVDVTRIHANADGVRGSGKRVWKKMPTIKEWTADVTFHVLASEITNDVFEETLRQAGAFVGIGQFRPQNGGYCGRFEVAKVKWS